MPNSASKCRLCALISVISGALEQLRKLTFESSTYNFSRQVERDEAEVDALFGPAHTTRVQHLIIPILNRLKRTNGQIPVRPIWRSLQSLRQRRLRFLSHKVEKLEAD